VLRQRFAGEVTTLRGSGGTSARLEVGHVTFTAPWHLGTEATARIAAVGVLRRSGAAQDPAPAFRRLGLEPWPASPVGPALGALGLAPPGAPVPPTFRIGPADGAAAAARKVLGRQAFKMDANTEGAVRDFDPEYVHDLRVATRRARAALRVFRGVVESRRTEWFRQELAWLGSALGAVRDLDVLAERMRVHSLRVGAPAAAVRRIEELLDARRAPAMEALRRALRSGRYRRVLKALRSGSGVGRGAAARAAGMALALVLAPARIRNAGKRVVRALRDGGEQPSAEALHAARIAFKRLRYACEFFAELYADEVRESIRGLVGIQDCLGRHQDAVVAEAVLREILAAERAGGDADMLVTLGALIQLQREEAGRERERFAELRRDLPGLLKRIRRGTGPGREAPPASAGESELKPPATRRPPATSGAARRPSRKR
jgi:CHAD domain-containing protein